MFLTRYNRFNRNGLDAPFVLMDEMRRELDRLLADGPFPASTSAGSPRGTIDETETGYVLRMDVPGLSAEGLVLRAEDGVLHLAGERKEEAPEGFEARRTERVRFRFDRRLKLPQDVDAERIEASLKDGVLTVTVPKSEKAAPRTIAVKAG